MNRRGQGESVTITNGDFMTGLLAGLAKQHVVTVEISDDFYDCVEVAFVRFTEMAVAAGHAVDFDSASVRAAITSAVQRDLVGIDSPVYQTMRMRISPDYAERYLADLPGDPRLYDDMASKFLECFAERTASYNREK